LGAAYTAAVLVSFAVLLASSFFAAKLIVEHRDRIEQENNQAEIDALTDMFDRWENHQDLEDIKDQLERWENRAGDPLIIQDPRFQGGP